MPLRNTAEAYGSVAKFLHWAIVLLILPQYFLADIADELPKGSPRASELLGLHKSIGLLVFILALVRIGWKLTHRTNPAPLGEVIWQRKAATAGHVILYVLILLQPLSGWAMASASGHSIRFFGWVTFPSLVGKNDALHEVLEAAHKTLFYVLLAVAVLHVAAAIYHHRVLKDDTLRRMLPFSRRSA
jgi:cytochrome b561